jgi:hypothetical protein
MEDRGMGMKEWWSYNCEGKNEMLRKILVLVPLYSRHVSH